MYSKCIVLVELYVATLKYKFEFQEEGYLPDSTIADLPDNKLPFLSKKIWGSHVTPTPRQLILCWRYRFNGREDRYFDLENVHDKLRETSAQIQDCFSGGGVDNRGKGSQDSGIVDAADGGFGVSVVQN